MEEIIYICPHCKTNLTKINNSYVCKNKHCFDISKYGYVNLLPVNEKHNLNPGDNDIMCDARINFLSNGYYYPLTQKLIEIIKNCKAKTILDAGCGTGYYINEIQKNFENTKCYGTDISKYAICKACKLNKNTHFSVSSIFNMPYKEKSFDVILNIFAPKPTDEFNKVLKDDGIIIEIIPNTKHLIELREFLYKDSSQRNQKQKNLPGFVLKETFNLSFIMDVQNNNDLINLFTMTPYNYKTNLEAKNKLSQIENMKITADFEIKIWKKEQK